jgi:hypothetical protein
LSRSTLYTLPLLFGAMLLSGLASSAYAEGNLDTIRFDVRNAPPPDPSPPPADPPARDQRRCDGSDNIDGGLVMAGLYVAGWVATSPYWLPRSLLGDQGSEAHFPGFPYDNTPGYLVSDAWMSGFTAEKVLAETWADASGPQSSPANDSAGAPTELPKGSLVTLSIDPSLRRWAGQFRADYAGNFDHLTGVGGQLILETTSRWGVDSQFQYLTERRFGRDDDHLNLGDCNLVYRFAQSPRAQMRMGLGANWLNDSTRTDLGFNFTYGGDYFPRKPWVFSTAIDWGTLGHAGLFRFRTTAGVIFNRFETYFGYEYLDIGSTQDSFLIGGVCVWF